MTDRTLTKADLLDENLADLDDNDNPANRDDQINHEEAQAEAPHEEDTRPSAAEPADADEKVKNFGEEKARRQSKEPVVTKRQGPKPIDFTKHAVTGVAFPLHLLPKVVSDFVGDTAYRMQTASDLVAIPAICAAGAMLGHEVTVQPMWNNSGWVERAAMWGVTIAPPSSMKTPAANAAMGPVSSLQGRLYREHQEELEAYAAAEDAHSAACVGVPRKDRPPAPVKPGLAETVLIDDMTTEKTAQLMCPLYNGNARGVLAYVDELAGWLTSFNQYKNGSGNDRQFWLKTWSGGATNRQRVRQEGTFYIPDCYLSIFGTIQPDVARTLFGGARDEDGMVQRFGLAVMPDVPTDPQPLDIAPNEEIAKAYKRRILELREVPEQRVKFSREAAEAFTLWDNRIRREAIALGGSPLGTHIGKYPALGARLALVWHFLEHGTKAPKEISLETFERVRRFVDEYIKPHAQRLYDAIEEHACKRAASRVAEWILKRHPPKFTAREIRKNDWREFNREKDSGFIGDVLNFLEAMNWVELRDPKTGPQGGRPTITAHVNPLVYEEFAAGLGK